MGIGGAAVPVHLCGCFKAMPIAPVPFVEPKPYIDDHIYVMTAVMEAAFTCLIEQLLKLVVGLGGFANQFVIGLGGRADMTTDNQQRIGD
ncbi:hypothetical protein GGQ79_004607 [Ochrobactrum pecoris]|uniref:Uncharacterized protein n=1 Tax=Brucella pecoris TaxID=867683 RepID=A0AB34YXT5_9HYPH|nr:hypothetical protein [Brucella pecoris]